MLPKAAYRDFEEDPDLEFEFFLAERLGKTLNQLRMEIDNDEFVRWSIYFARKAQRRELELKRGR